jgi:hypothetical protein
MLVLFVSGSTGVAAVLGSVLGASVNHEGLSIGALCVGLIGVRAAVLLSKALRFIEANEIRPAMLGGCTGFLLAAPLAAADAHKPAVVRAALDAAWRNVVAKQDVPDELAGQKPVRPPTAATNRKSAAGPRSRPKH